MISSPSILSLKHVDDSTVQSATPAVVLAKDFQVPLLVFHSAPYAEISLLPAIRFVQLVDCDYVMASTYREYGPHNIRASGVVQDMVKTKEQWETVSSHEACDIYALDCVVRSTRDCSAAQIR